MRKLPHVTVLFWVLKIIATTLGETGGDLLSQTLNVGYLVSSLLFIGLFVVSLVFQLKATGFHPALYWTVIVATSTAGTTMSDFLNRSVGLGYPGGASVLITCLAVVFVVWKRSGQTFDVQQIRSFRGEVLYWIAILFSNTLGTSTGDFLAHTSGAGFADGALILSAVMLLLIGAHYLTKIPSVVLFWIAFVLTRPLGATAGDTLSKPYDEGGLQLGTEGTSAVLLALLAILVAYSVVKERKQAKAQVSSGQPLGVDELFVPQTEPFTAQPESPRTH